MRTLIVTGASRGLGRFIAETAAAQGFRVIGLARSAVAGLSYELRACDVSDSHQVDKIFHDLRGDETLFGLVNAAGVASMNLLIMTPPETRRRIIDTNLLGTIHCSAAMGKLLARRKTGRIVNFSTIAVALGLKGEAVYAASKGGIETFSRAFAREMADFNVTVNVVAPGPIPTALIEGVPQSSIQTIIDRQIIRRQGTPQDVWNIVSLLLDDRAAMVSGEVIAVGGS